MTRQKDLDRFYALLGDWVAQPGHLRRLGDPRAGRGLPTQGVYFLFEPGELRADGTTLRVTRVGTHAVSAGSHSTLWQRLRAHRGTLRGSSAGGGNHRGSVFRRHVGEALLARDGHGALETWGKGSTASRLVRQGEHNWEVTVSSYLADFLFTWVPLPGPASADNDRARLERNAIALLSNLRRPGFNPPSPRWLGRSSSTAEIQASGLWNVEHVAAQPQGGWLDVLEASLAR